MLVLHCMNLINLTNIWLRIWQIHLNLSINLPKFCIIWYSLFIIHKLSVCRCKHIMQTCMASKYKICTNFLKSRVETILDFEFQILKFFPKRLKKLKTWILLQDFMPTPQLSWLSSEKYITQIQHMSIANCYHPCFELSWNQQWGDYKKIQHMIQYQRMLSQS